MTIEKDMSLANIVKVDIREEVSPFDEYSLTDVYTEADATAFVSEGEEKESRVKNVIKAQNKTEDIVKGYDLRFLSVSMVPEILALIDGGTWDEGTQKYSAPPVGAVVERTPFAVDVYTEEKDVNGDTLNFVKFVYPHCTGKPINYIFKDGEFFLPELTAKSRPGAGQSPVEFYVLEDILIHVEYVAEGEVEGILPAGVSYAEGKFTLSIQVKEFTFTDDSKNMKAIKGKGHWVIREV